jgi:uncharacterized membrane protein
MTTTALHALIGMVGFMLLDGLWLGLIMKGFYRDQLQPIARMAEGGMAPNWPAAFVVYVLLGLGIAVFAMPRATSLGSAAVFGAVLGLVIYGVYDFTNFATLRQWPLALVFVDVAWGAVACAACTAAAWTLTR